LCQRQAALGPGAQAAFQAYSLVVALLAQDTGGARRVAAPVAYHDNRLVLGQRTQFSLKIGRRQMTRLRYAAGFEGFVTADIQEYPFLLVGQLHGLLGAYRFTAAFQQVG